MKGVHVARVTLHRAGGAIPRQGNARSTWDRRDSVIVALHDGEGRVGLGEAAPLPGFAASTLDLVRLAARAPSSPAEAYALELAALDLQGQREGQPVHRVLDPTSSDAPIEVSALLGPPCAGDVTADARRRVTEGARTLKLKLGAAALDDEVDAVRRLRAALGPDVTLVGDANGAWSLDEARAALERLAPLHFDYIEQPVAPADLLRLGPVAIPVWADESLADAVLRDEVLEAEAVAGVVCKPTVLGGLGWSIRTAIRAHARGKRVVVTHALEGPVALAGCAVLARVLADIAPRAGIWPHPALAAFPEVGLPGFTAGTLGSLAQPGLGFTDDERRRLLALPRIEGVA